MGFFRKRKGKHPFETKNKAKQEKKFFRPRLEALEDRTLLNAAPILEFLPDVSTQGSNLVPISIRTQDADGDLLNISVRLMSSTQQALQLQQGLGLTFTGSYYQNAQGQDEKWMYNPSTGVWFAILPSGELKRWGGNWASSPAVGRLDSFFHTDPSLLWNAASAQPLAYQLKQTHGLTFPGSYYQNAHGFDEKWLYNPDGGVWFALLPNGELRRLTGAVSSIFQESNLLATLDTAYWNQPNYLWNAGPDAIAPVFLTINGDQLTIDPADGYLGSFAVHVSVSDGLAEAKQAFTVTSIQTVPTLAAIGNQFIGVGQDSLTIPLQGADENNTAFAYSASLIGSTPQALKLQRDLGLTFPGEYYENAQGQGEKWMYNPSTGVWFAILPSGELKRWGGSWGSSPVVARLETFFHADPSLLWNAASAQPLAYQLKQSHGLTFAGSYYQNVHGYDEKWLYNPTMGIWFALLPNGELRRLTGAVSSIFQQSNLLATLDRAYWNEPEYLWNARPDLHAPVFLTVNGDQLTIDPADGYLGSFALRVSVNGGAATTDFDVQVVELSPDEFAQMIEQIDTDQPPPASEFVLDWTKYGDEETSQYAEGAVFEITAAFLDMPGVSALAFATLPANPTSALLELRNRVGGRLALLDEEISGLATDFGNQQYQHAGIATYAVLRAKLVQQASLLLLEQHLSQLQAGREEEANRVAGVRDTAFNAPASATSLAENLQTLEEELAAIQAGLGALIAHLGVLSLGSQTALDLETSAKFQATSLEAAVVAQEIQSALDSGRTSLVALQEKEAELREILANPADHTQWTPSDGVDFALGSISGAFGTYSLPPDNKTIITAGSANNLVEFRDIITGLPVTSYTTEYGLRSVASTSDGLIWTREKASFYAYVRLIDPATGQKLWDWETDTSLGSLVASADGSLVAVSANRTVSLLRRNGNSVTRQEFVFADNVQSDMHFSPDGTYLAVPMQNTLVLVNLNSGETYSFGGFGAYFARSTAWSGDGTLLAVGDDKGFVQIIDVPTKQILGSLQIPNNKSATALAFSPNQALLASGDSTTGLIFWDVTRLNQISEYSRSTGAKNLFFFQKSNSGNTMFARADNSLIAFAMPAAGKGAPISRESPPILDPVPPTAPASPDRPAWSQSGKVAGTLGTVASERFSSISPDGQSFVIPDGGVVTFRSIATGQVTQSIQIGGVIPFAALSGDGQKLYLASNEINSSALKVRDMNTGAIGVLATFPAFVKSFALDASHGVAAMSDHAGGSRVRVIDLTTGLSEEIAGTENHSEALAISESGKYVAVGLENGSVVIWNRETKESRTVGGLSRSIKALAWSHGTDSLLAAADDNAKLAIFSPVSSQPYSVFSFPYDSDPTTALQFSSNNLLLFRGANANGLVTLDVSNPASPRISQELPLLALNGVRPLALSATGATLYTTAISSVGVGSTFITGVTIPVYGRGQANPTPPPAQGPAPSPAPLNSAQQNELAAPTTLENFNATQRQYLLDSVTIYFQQRVKEGGTAGIPSFYLDATESNPALIGLSAGASYRDFYVQLAADLRAKWPLQNVPTLDPFAGGSGVYTAPAEPVAPPTQKPVQVQQRYSVEQLVLAQLAPPVNLGAGKWVNVVDPNSNTHVGLETNAVDLNMILDDQDSNPFFDRGQPVFAPAQSFVVDLDRAVGWLVLRTILSLPDGSSVNVYLQFRHLKIDPSLARDMTLRRGQQFGTIDLLTDGSQQANGRLHIRPHLHWSVHLGSLGTESLNLTNWLSRHGIDTLVDPEGRDTGGSTGMGDSGAEGRNYGFEFSLSTVFTIAASETGRHYRVSIEGDFADWISPATEFKLSSPSLPKPIFVNANGSVQDFGVLGTAGVYTFTITKLRAPTNAIAGVKSKKLTVHFYRDLGGSTNNTNFGSSSAVQPNLFKTFTRDLYALNESQKVVDLNGDSIENPISPNTPVWLVIHGRNSSSGTEDGEDNNIYWLADALAKEFSGKGDRVVLLDWEQYAEDNLNEPPFPNSLTGARWIPGVAAWAVRKLKDNLKIDPSQLRIVGHSWGSFLAFEIARGLFEVTGKDVKAIVALDSANNALKFLGNDYDAGQVNFSTYSDNSWAFEGSVAALDIRSASARHTIKVAFPEGTPSQLHGYMIDTFTWIVNNQKTLATNEIAARFDLESLIKNSIKGWRMNDYPNDGDFMDNAVSPGYEAILYATIENSLAKPIVVKPDSLQYVDQTGHLVHATPTQAPQADPAGNTFQGAFDVGGVFPRTLNSQWVGGLNSVNIYKFTSTSANVLNVSASTNDVSVEILRPSVITDPAFVLVRSSKKDVPYNITFG